MIEGEAGENMNSQKKQKKVFDCALYLTPPKHELNNLCTPVKNCHLGKEVNVVTNGSEITLTPSDLSNQHLKQSDIKNCISNDLLKKLDESSPLKALVFSDEKSKSSPHVVLYSANEENNADTENIDENSVFEDEPTTLHNPQTKEVFTFKTNQFLKLLNENGAQNNFEKKDEILPGVSCKNLKSFTAPIYQDSNNQLSYKDMANTQERKLNEDLKGGWLCPYCRNFNIEKRKKCNQCKKSPNKFQPNIVRENLFNFSSLNLNEKNQNEPDFERKDSNSTANSSIYISQNNTIINVTNTNTYEEQEKDSTEHKKKKLHERVGDWICIKCRNLNFSFRVICNRCELPKSENDMLYEKYMNDMANYTKVSELFNKHSQFNQSYVNYINSQCFIANQSARINQAMHFINSSQSSIMMNPGMMKYQFMGQMGQMPSQFATNQYINMVHSKQSMGKSKGHSMLNNNYY